MGRRELRYFFVRRIERFLLNCPKSCSPLGGAFPTIIAVITIFFTGSVLSAPLSSALSALMLLGVIILGVAVTLLTSRLLSKTLLKGIPSSFALELPPYRTPQIGKVIVRSIFDRTLYVLGRAASVAAPAGAVIWILSNVRAGDISLLNHCTEFLDPLGKLMGLDGVILFAFILGLPANEIVLPIILMSYMGTGSITGYENLEGLGKLLSENGWNVVTAICFILFSLMHFPCATTCITIYKETKSIKWTGAAFLLPTVIGMLFCVLVNLTGTVLGC